MRVLVTGGAGFIGSNLVRRLQSQHEVTVLDDLSTGLQSNLEGLPVQVFEGSVTDRELVIHAAAGTQAIVHLAARGSVPRSIVDPEATHRVNCDGTLNILEAARTSGARVIYSSSSSVYGANDALPKREDMWVRPLSPYAASKLAAEGYCAAYDASYGVPTLALRFFNVYGPWQRPDHDYAAVIPRWIWALLNVEPVMVEGDGSQSRDFTHVATVVDVIAHALEDPGVFGQQLNLAYGNRISLVELLRLLEEITETPARIEYRDRRASDVAHSQNDPTRLLEAFPAVVPVSLPDGLAETVMWMREHKQTAS